MYTIWKLTFRDSNIFTLEHPIVKYLDIQKQYGEFRAWVVVDLTITGEFEYEFSFEGTGWLLEKDIISYTYVGTVQEAGGSLIWHCFAKEIKHNINHGLDKD